MATTFKEKKNLNKIFFGYDSNIEDIDCTY